MVAKSEDEFISGAETSSRNKAEFESRQVARQASAAGLLARALPIAQSQSSEASTTAAERAEPTEPKSETAAPNTR